MSDTPRAPIGPERARRRAEAADDAERERLRQLVGTTVEWFSDPVAGRTFPYTPPTEETP